MQLTVDEARTFGGLKECKLLAGEKGLNRVIRCVDSMEIPDIRQWLQQGEFLVTTGYALKDNSEALVQAVEALADKNGSGLALKTRFIGEISGSVLERAEELGIPIFEMPAEMPTISLTEPLVRRVITGELQSSSKELAGEQLWHQQANFYTELVLGIISAALGLIQRIAMADRVHGDKYGVAYARFAQLKSQSEKYKGGASQ